MDSEDAPIEPSCEPVLLPDPELDLAVREALEIGAGPISADAMASLIGLDVRVARLETLEGLQCATNIQSLVLRSAAKDPVSLLPLAGLTKVEVLDLELTNVTDLEAVSSLTELRELNLNLTGIDDLGPLATLKKLRHLEAGANEIVDLSPLAGLTALEDLDIGGNAIEDLSPLVGLPALRHLSLANNEIADVTPLASFDHLGVVVLRQNKIVDISPLVGKTWTLPEGCGDILLWGNPLDEASLHQHAPQICKDAGVYIDRSLAVGCLCEMSCTKAGLCDD